MTPTEQSIFRRTEIGRIIAQYGAIAELSVLRDDVLKQVAQPIEYLKKNRRARLHPFDHFFKWLLDPNAATSPRMRSLASNIRIAAQFGWQMQEFRSIPSTFDHRFNEPNDLLEPIFAAIFEDEHLLRRWMATLDNHVARISQRKLAMMDQAVSLSARPLRKEIVLIGGGPLTSLVASVLGAFYQVTVVTDQRGLGKPWRNRQMYINSSSTITDFNGRALPLQGGPTTRVIGSQQLGNLDVNLLLGTACKTVRCDDGRIIEYVAGPRLGALVATNIIFNADDYLINQRVDITQMQRCADGDLQLTLVDTQDGTRRDLRASAVFLLTGPGPEQSKVEGGQSRQVYRASLLQVDMNVQATRANLSWYREALQLVEAHQDTPGIPIQWQWLRAQRARIAQAIALPPLLTLTALEKLYEFWNEDLDADPDAFLFSRIFAEKGAYIGGGDTMRIHAEWRQQRGPASAYPKNFQGKRVATRATIYNERATSPQTYDQNNRRRYAGIFTANTTAVPFKVLRYRLIDGPFIEITYRDAAGTIHRNRYRSVFDATGLSKKRIEDDLPASFHLHMVHDLQGNIVARGDDALFIAGTAAGLNISDFPQGIQRIIAILGVPENTISLWVHGLLTERLALTYLATRKPTKQLSK